jgi:hypothetical protein
LIGNFDNFSQISSASRVTERYPLPQLSSSYQHISNITALAQQQQHSDKPRLKLHLFCLVFTALAGVFSIIHLMVPGYKATKRKRMERMRFEQLVPFIATLLDR